MADRARRAAARLAQDEESQGLARRWRSLHRALTSDRGLWSDGDVSQTCHWKLDKSEDPQRRWDLFLSCNSKKHLGLHQMFPGPPFSASNGNSGQKTALHTVDRGARCGS